MLAALLLIALHAPRPLAAPKAPAPAPLSPVGSWTLEWNGGEGPCRFDKDGSFSCLWAGTQWLGLWTMEETETPEGKGRTLTVSEWIPAADEWTPASQSIRWRAALRTGELSGPLDGGSGMFRLRKDKRGKR
jgi:hypothetical protein